MLQPNAGLPCLEHGETHYHVTPEEYVESMKDIWQEVQQSLVDAVEQHQNL